MTAHDEAVEAAEEALAVAIEFSRRGQVTPLAEAAVAAAAPILLAPIQAEVESYRGGALGTTLGTLADDLRRAERERDEARAEIERLNGIIYRVAWRHAHILGDIGPTEEIEPGYDLEDLHARFQTRIGIERLEAENEKRSERRKLLDTVLNLPIRWPVDTKTAYVLRDDILRAFLNR